MSDSSPAYVGIDPGKGGGLALLSPAVRHVHAQAWKMPDTPQGLASLLRAISISKHFPVHVCVEHVHSSPQMGVASAFSFGRAYGVILGTLAGLAVPFDLVSPPTWQKALGCMSGGDKNVTKLRAAGLFPSVTVTHAVADALLIAEFCRRSRSN